MQSARNHDKAKKFTKTQCNSNTNQNNMTGDVKSAISTAAGAGAAVASTAATAATAATSGNTSAIAADAARYKSGLSDVAADGDVDSRRPASSVAPSVFSTGCATMPRTRQHGSAAATATATSGSGSGSGAETTPSCSVTADKSDFKLAALDNLDLAHSLDLLDVEGEDPYGALQDYLERVKVSAFHRQQFSPSSSPVCPTLHYVHDTFLASISSWLPHHRHACCVHWEKHTPFPAPRQLSTRRDFANDDFA